MITLVEEIVPARTYDEILAMFNIFDYKGDLTQIDPGGIYGIQYQTDPYPEWLIDKMMDVQYINGTEDHDLPYLGCACRGLYIPQEMSFTLTRDELTTSYACDNLTQNYVGIELDNCKEVELELSNRHLMFHDLIRVEQLRLMWKNDL